MATHLDHIGQAKRNLAFLEQINKNAPTFYDWQVTVCFYSALHLINAHLSHFNLQYRKHKDVKDALNPFTLSPARLPENEYTAYTALQSLSRRARYLVNEKDGQIQSTQAFLTYEKHLSKALKHLDTLMSYFNGRYQLNLNPIIIHCSELKYTEVKFIKK